MRAFLDGLTTFEYVMIMVIVVTSSVASIMKIVVRGLKIKLVKMDTERLERENRKLRGY